MEAWAAEKAMGEKMKEAGETEAARLRHNKSRNAQNAARAAAKREATL